MSDYKDEFDQECDWFNAEYEKLFGEKGPFESGVNLRVVHAAFSRIIRHHIEEMKEAIAEAKK